jgi:ATP-dependent RNA helicase DOB1
MSSNVKRAAEGHPDAGTQQNKVAKLDVDRVAPMPTGSNLIEIDGKSCTHEVCWPPGETGSMAPPPKREGPPAREYPFQLDPFQQTAINCLENGEGCSWR